MPRGGVAIDARECTCPPHLKGARRRTPAHAATVFGYATTFSLHTLSFFLLIHTSFPILFSICTNGLCTSAAAALAPQILIMIEEEKKAMRREGLSVASYLDQLPPIPTISGKCAQPKPTTTTLMCVSTRRHYCARGGMSAASSCTQIVSSIAVSVRVHLLFMLTCVSY